MGPIHQKMSAEDDEEAIRRIEERFAKGETVDQELVIRKKKKKKKKMGLTMGQFEDTKGFVCV